MRHVSYGGEGVTRPTNMKESCLTYEWVMSHIWTSMSHIWMSHVSYEWMSHVHSCKTVRAGSFTRETWLPHMWDTTHWYGRHDAFTCETWLTHMWDMTHPYVQATVQQLAEKVCVLKAIDVNLQVCIYRHRSLFICVDMTHSYERYDSFICVTWLVHMCGMADKFWKSTMSFYVNVP